MSSISNGGLWATIEFVFLAAILFADSDVCIDVSAFSYSKRDRLPIFKPISKPLCEFPTPILQLDSLKSSTHPNISGRYLFPSDCCSNH